MDKFFSLHALLPFARTSLRNYSFLPGMYYQLLHIFLLEVLLLYKTSFHRYVDFFIWERGIKKTLKMDIEASFPAVYGLYEFKRHLPTISTESPQ